MQIYDAKVRRFIAMLYIFLQTAVLSTKWQYKKNPHRSETMGTGVFLSMLYSCRALNLPLGLGGLVSIRQPNRCCEREQSQIYLSSAKSRGGKELSLLIPYAYRKVNLLLLHSRCHHYFRLLCKHSDPPTQKDHERRYHL